MGTEISVNLAVYFGVYFYSYKISKNERIPKHVFIFLNVKVIKMHLIQFSD